MVNAATPRIRPEARKRAEELLSRAIDLEKVCASLDPHIGGRRVDFWVDADVRRAAIVLHGELYRHEVETVIAERFGAERVPSKSSLDRLWQKLAKAKKTGWRLW